MLSAIICSLAVYYSSLKLTDKVLDKLMNR